MDVIMTAPQVTYRVFVLGDKLSEYSRYEAELLKDQK
jgi:hypothetical protein